MTVFLLLTVALLSTPGNCRDAPNKELHSFRLSGSQVNECESEADSNLFQVNGLKVSPEVITVPGNVSLTLSATVMGAISAPFKAVVDMKLKLPNDKSVSIPCVGKIGSCSFEDICSEASLSDIDFCPIPAGDYSVGKYDLPLPAIPVV